MPTSNKKVLLLITTVYAFFTCFILVYLTLNRIFSDGLSATNNLPMTGKYLTYERDVK